MSAARSPSGRHLRRARHSSRERRQSRRCAHDDRSPFIALPVEPLANAVQELFGAKRLFENDRIDREALPILVVRVAAGEKDAQTAALRARGRARPLEAR